MIGTRQGEREIPLDRPGRVLPARAACEFFLVGDRLARLIGRSLDPSIDGLTDSQTSIGGNGGKRAPSAKIELRLAGGPRNRRVGASGG